MEHILHKKVLWTASIDEACTKFSVSKDENMTWILRKYGVYSILESKYVELQYLVNTR